MSSFFLMPILMTTWTQAAANAPQETPEEREKSRDFLRSLSIEELFKVNVVTAARKEQPINRTPAAVFVLRGEEIRRLGIRSIVEALRYVPGTRVVRFDSSTWGVGVRGFTGRFTPNLQVLVDGRSVYTPIFSGVFWDMQDTLLEDIDRIEIIRGPGAAVWGANSVNGVINIITKSAKDTQGGFVEAGAGTEESDFAGGRWGGKQGDDFHYRAYAKYFNRDEQKDGNDDWFQARGGLRLDASPSENDHFTFQSEYYESKAHHERTVATLAAPFTDLFIDRVDFWGGHLMGRWERQFTDDSSVQVQINYEHSRRRRETSDQELDMGEIDLQHRFRPLEGHDVVWGGGYRVSSDDIGNTFSLSYDPGEEVRHYVNAYLQDEITLVPDTLSFVAGSKFEYNSHTGFEVQPTLRLGWTVTDRHYLWAAASRAVRTPSRANDDVRINAAVFGGPTVLAVFGNRNVESEELLAFEAGYRARPVDDLIVDLTAFHHTYDELIDGVPGPFFIETTPPPAHGVVSIITDNAIEGVSYGFEVATTLDVLDEWRLSGTYTFMRVHMKEIEDTLVSTEDEALEGEPRHLATLRSSWDLPQNIMADIGLRFTDRVRTTDLGSWTEMDARIGWRPADDLEIGLVGQNLLRKKHRETGSANSAGITVTEVERGFYVYAGWSF